MSAAMEYRSNATIPLTVKAEKNGAGVTGANVAVFIRRQFDNQYWDQDGIQEFVEARTPIAMLEIDTTNSKGWWEFFFETSVGESIDNYIFEFIDLSNVSDNMGDVDKLFAYVGNYLDVLEINVARILGLSHENFVVEGLKFDCNRQLTGRARIYNNADAALENDGATDLNAQYKIASTYDDDGNLLTFTQTLEFLNG